MEFSLDFNQLVMQPLAEMMKGIIAYIPNVVSATLTILFGVFLAIVAKAAIRVLLKSASFDAFSVKIGLFPDSREAGVPGTAPHQYLALIVYWVIVLSAVIIALGNLRLHAASMEVNAIFGYALTILTVVVLAIIGLVLSMLVYRIIKTTATSAGYSRPEIPATVGKWVVLSFVFLVCLFRIGIPQEAFLIFLGATYVTMCITFIIAFGIGGSGFASEVLQKLLKTSDNRK